jgi:hypothetical protein
LPESGNILHPDVKIRKTICLTSSSFAPGIPTSDVEPAHREKKEIRVGTFSSIDREEGHLNYFASPRSLADRNVAFMGMLLLDALFALDAWTTSLGLASGGQERGLLASIIILNFGIVAFVLLKLSASVLEILLARLFRTWTERNTLFRWAYLVASLSLACGSIYPVINNLLLLRII